MERTQQQIPRGFRDRPGLAYFAEKVNLAADALNAEHPNLPIVLGGIFPIAPLFMERMKAYDVIRRMDAVAVHGFPLDWNHWQIHEGPTS